MVKFSDEQAQQLVSMYQQGQSGVEMAKRLGVHRNAIYRTLRKMGLEARTRTEAARNRSPVTPDIEKQIREGYTRGFSSNKMSEVTGLSVPTVIRILNESNMLRKRPKYECNHHYFDDIDTEEKAYWLGFIAADGCVHEATKSGAAKLSVRLGSKDEDHLYKLRDALESTHRIFEYKRPSGYGNTSVSILDITSNVLAAALTKHGVGPRKTFTLQWPQHLLPELMHHYLRGYVDGDGGWCCCRTPAGPQWTFHVTGNLSFIEDCQTFLMHECELRKTKPQNLRNQPKITQMRYGGNDQVQRIAQFLYGGSSVWLARKFNIVKPFLHIK